MHRVAVTTTALAFIVTTSLAGCSSSAKPAASSSSTTKASAAPSGGSTTTAPGSSSDPSADLGSLTQEIQGAKTATFKATWTSTDSNGNASTVTLEQSPPKSLFISGSSDSGEIISTGSTTYICSGSSGSQSCISESGTNPLQGLLDVYTGGTFLTEAQSLEAMAAAKVAGVDIKVTSETIAGQASKCVSVTGGGQTGKYCVTNSGILASASGGGRNFTLTSYSSSVDQSDFNLPSGASVQTIPGGQ